MNEFQSIESGSGILKNFYGDSKNTRSPLAEALKRKRDKRHLGTLDPEEQVEFLKEQKDDYR